MKKLLVGITILAFVMIASSVMAAGPKIPKTLCLAFGTYGDYQQLAFKAMGNIPTSGGNMKMYNINGTAYTGFDNPASGTGYLMPSGVLHASYKSQTATNNYWWTSWELWFDLNTNSGTIYFHHENSSGSKSVNTDSVLGVDCQSLSLPSAMDEYKIDKADGKPLSTPIR